MSSFMTTARTLATSESVTEGHPDKACDQVSDAVVDHCLTIDPHAHVACEVAMAAGTVMIFGEIRIDPERGRTNPDELEQLCRQELRNIPYHGDWHGIDPDETEIRVIVNKQSQEINAAVVGAAHPHDRRAETGAGDQGMMIGFACDETPELMPMTIMLAHQLARELAAARRCGTLPFLRADGKSQVTVEYEHGVPKRVATVLISTQHDPDVSQQLIAESVIDAVIRPVVPAHMLDADTRLLVNPSGSFILGGPGADAGLTGRKIIVDTYGGMARHGGGAFSGKDPTKVDRSGAYAARYVAKNIVAAGLARRCELQVSYAIGVAEPLALQVETFGTGRVDDSIIEQLIRRHFDLRPGGIIEDLQLERPIYRPTAVYGHFGRNDVPWERVDKAPALAADAGLRVEEA